MFAAPFFERGTMLYPALSLKHFRLFLERSVGPLQKLVESLSNDPSKLEIIRQQFEELCSPYFHGNLVHQDYLLTRAQAH